MTAVLIGFVSGIISGMGIGGGAILIPALIFIFNIQQKVAQGINLAYFIPTGIIAIIVHIKNKNADLKTAFIIGLCATVGASAGSLAAMYTENNILRRLFGLFLLFVGIREVAKAFKPQ